MKIEVKSYINKMVLSGNGETVTVLPDVPFSTSRQLVGKFFVAEDCMRKGLLKLGAIKWYKRAPKVNIYPQELIEGGISEVEERCFMELAYGAGSRETRVFV